MLSPPTSSSDFTSNNKNIIDNNNINNNINNSLNNKSNLLSKNSKLNINTNNTNNTNNNNMIINSPVSLPEDPNNNLNIINPNSNNDNDQYSLNSSISRSSFNSRADNSLIFERLVQDPLIDAQPIPHSLPRHISSETFIPASLDTTTHLLINNNNNNNTNTIATNNNNEINNINNSINNNSFNLNDSVDNLNLIDNHDDSILFGFNSRRSSLANLEAALGPPSRRTSTANLQAYRLNSNNSNSLSRSQTNSSFSNLTQQFQNSNLNSSSSNSNSNLNSNSNSKRIPQNSNPLQLSNQSNQNLPPLTKTNTSSSINSQRNNNTSPLLNNKSFCSYADIIAQDDQESKFQIRRPSISLSLSTQKIARTNSMSSQLGNNNNNSPGIGCCNSPRSPINYNNSSFININNNSNNNRSNSISNSLNTRNLRNSPSIKSELNPLNSAIDDSQEYTTSIRRSGFSGRPINLGGYSMRLSNSNATTNSSITNNSSSQNIDSLLTLKKKDLSPQSSRSIKSDLISDDESIKSFKTANLSTE